MQAGAGPGHRPQVAGLRAAPTWVHRQPWCPCVHCWLQAPAPAFSHVGLPELGAQRAVAAAPPAHAGCSAEPPWEGGGGLGGSRVAQAGVRGAGRGEGCRACTGASCYGKATHLPGRSERGNGWPQEEGRSWQRPEEAGLMAAGKEGGAAAEREATEVLSCELPPSGKGSTDAPAEARQRQEHSGLGHFQAAHGAMQRLSPLFSAQSPAVSERAAGLGPE